MPVDKLEIVFDELDEFVDQQMIGLLFEVHANLVQDTPVDLGWARSQFVPRIGQPYRISLTDIEPSSGAAAAASSQAQSELTAIAASYSSSQGKIFISNNVPYIQALNDGHSPQAPPGYIPAAVQRAVMRFGGRLI